jgi:hypothetical protein
VGAGTSAPASGSASLAASSGGFLGASDAMPAVAAASLRGGTPSFLGGFLGSVLARPAAAAGESGEPSSQLSGFLAPDDDELRGEHRLPDLRRGFLGTAIR